MGVRTINMEAWVSKTISTAQSAVLLQGIDVERKTPASQRHVHPALISKTSKIWNQPDAYR